jgi:hypothetical protein
MQAIGHLTLAEAPAEKHLLRNLSNLVRADDATLRLVGGPGPGMNRVGMNRENRQKRLEMMRIAT